MSEAVPERPEWEQLARRAAAVIGEEEPLRLEFATGRLFVDHPGPALVVHRCAGAGTGDPALDRRAACSAAHRLVTSQPAYLLATGGPDDQDGVCRLATAAVSGLTEHVGAALVIEVWTPLDEDGDEDVDPFDRRPGFTVYAPDDDRANAAADALSDALSEIEIAGQAADVTCIVAPEIAPPGLEPLLEPRRGGVRRP